MRETEKLLPVGQHLRSLSDDDLAAIGSAWFAEKGRREDLKFQARDECPSCWGTGEEGNEGDAYDCPRCKGTGKYPPLLNDKDLARRALDSE